MTTVVLILCLTIFSIFSIFTYNFTKSIAFWTADVIISRLFVVNDVKMPMCEIKPVWLPYVNNFQYLKLFNNFN